MKKNYLLLIILFTICITAEAQTWGTFGSGANKPVLAMKPYNGGLIVGGNFDTINNVRSQCLIYYKYTGSSYFWSDELAKGYKTSATFPNFSLAYIDAIEVFDDRIHIGGEFFHPFYFDAINIAYLTWNPFPNSSWDFNPYFDSPNQVVYALKKMGNQLFIGGNFNNFIGLNFIPTNYVTYINSGDYPSPKPIKTGDELNARVKCLEVYNGELYAGGNFTATFSGATPLSFLAKWDGIQWSDVGGGITSGTVNSLTVYNNELIVGGYFTLAGSTTVESIAAWNGTSWSALADGLSRTSQSGYVYALKTYAGSLYAGGDFDNSGTTILNNIAKWDGNTWTSLGSGVNGNVRCLDIVDNSVVVGGDFTQANGTPANYIAYYRPYPVGISNNTIQFDFNIMPNPANNIIVIETPQTTSNVTLTIYTIDGKEVINQAVTGIKTQLDINKLKNGIYFIQLFTDEKSIIKKFVKY